MLYSFFIKKEGENIYNYYDLDISDFYFNGRWLSDFDCMIAGTNGFNNISLLPNQKTETEEVLGIDGLLPVNTYYEPRTFTIPIYIKNLNKIRDISAWLGVKTVQDFYFKNDKIKLKVKLDGKVDAIRYNRDGLTEIKFIAYDPYFYAIENIEHTFKKNDRGYNQVNPFITYNAVNIIINDRYTPASYELLNTNDIEGQLKNGADIIYNGIVNKFNGQIINQISNFNDELQFWNDGNVESQPLFNFILNDDVLQDIEFIVNDSETISLNGIKNKLIIDMKYMTVISDIEVNVDGTITTLTDENVLYKYTGNFIKLKNGINKIKIIKGNISNLTIQTRSRWI